MLSRTHFPVAAALALLPLAMLLGCSSADQQQAAEDVSKEGTASAHQHPHDVPLTEKEIATLKEETANYTDAVSRIKQYRDTIRQETTGGEPAKAHRALDYLDLVLERLPEAARDSGVPKAKWQEVNVTAQELRDLFNQVHANIDEGKEPNYGAVADQIDQAVETLASIQPQQND